MTNGYMDKLLCVNLLDFSMTVDRPAEELQPAPFPLRSHTNPPGQPGLRPADRGAAAKQSLRLSERTPRNNGDDLSQYLIPFPDRIRVQRRFREKG